MRVFRERLSIFVCLSLSFDFKGEMWDLVVLIPDHCLSIYYDFISCLSFYFTLNYANYQLIKYSSTFQPLATNMHVCDMFRVINMNCLIPNK